MNENALYGDMFDKLVIADLIQFERLYRDQQQYVQIKSLRMQEFTLYP
jgi:hypothetical protein